MSHNEAENNLPRAAQLASNDTTKESARVDEFGVQMLQVMKGEIDALQIAVSEKKRPWYLDAATVISIVALAFSFATTFISSRRTAAEDIQNSREELRALLQRLAALPRESVEASKTYAPDQAAVYRVTGFIAQESAMLALHAAELARTLPSDKVSAVEYYSVAQALDNGSDLSAPKEFAILAAQRSTEFVTEVAALRLVASLEFRQGSFEAGRQRYRQTLEIFSKYPGRDQFTMAEYALETEIYWSEAEWGLAGQWTFAEERLRRAQEVVDSLPPGAARDGMAARLAEAIAQFNSSSKGQTRAQPIEPIRPSSPSLDGEAWRAPF